MRWMLFAILAFNLGGCAAHSIEDSPPATIKPIEVKVPVAVPCRQKGPEPLQTLQQRYSDADWQEMPLGAVAQAVRAQAGRRMNEVDQVRAASAGCAMIPP